MRYRLLGRTGLYVSEICLGTMTYGGKGRWEVVGRLGLEEAQAQIKAAFDAGVNFLDTANVYSEGESEKLVGQALARLGLPREDLVIATKVRVRMGPTPNRVGLTKVHIMNEAHTSLRRLGLDHIDLYQIHGVDQVTPLDETLRALEDLVRAGKVRYIGVSNHAAWQIMKGLGISERQGWSRFESIQAYYSIAGRELEREIVPVALDQSLSILVWSPLAGGLLTGKYRRDGSAPAGSRQLTDWDEPPVHDQARLYDTIDVLVSIGEERGVSAAQVALAWLLGRPAVSTVLVGARSGEQLADNLRAADLVLHDEERRRLDEASRLPLLYPYWHQAKAARDRLSPADLTLLGPHL